MLAAHVTNQGSDCGRDPRRLSYLVEAAAFMDDLKRIPLLSDAGSTGCSYHTNCSRRAGEAASAERDVVTWIVASAICLWPVAPGGRATARVRIERLSIVCGVQGSRLCMERVRKVIE